MPPAKGEAVGFTDVQAMLVDGGFFRAKLSAFLSEFDIVAGGLSWGIRCSRFAIDVEFVEDAAIRHKIKVAENICKALKKMQCPTALHPHQIQGLDYPVLKGVFAWLLKRVKAAREENAYFVRQQTKLQFERRFGVPLFDTNVRPDVSGPSVDSHTHEEPAPHFQLDRVHFNAVAAGHALPKRVQVTSGTPSFRNVDEHVSSVLLEYGDRYVVTEAALGADDDDDAQERRERQAQQEAEERERVMVERLAATMETHQARSKLSSAGLGSVLASTDQGKLSRLHAQYQARKEDLEAQLAAEEAERNRLERRQAKLSELQSEEETLKAKVKKAKSQAAKAETAAAEVSAAVVSEETAVTELEDAVVSAEAEARTDAARADALDGVLSKREQVKELEAEIDAATERRMAELSELKDEVAAMQEQVSADGGAEALNTAEVERLTTMKQQLETELTGLEAENLDLQRRIDMYPTRLELQQYQTRMSELDEEIAWKYEETKLTFFRYNTHVEVMRCAENELEVFTQMASSYEHARGEGDDRADSKAAARAKEMEEAHKDFKEDVTRFAQQLSLAKKQQAEKLSDEQRSLRDRTHECAALVSRQQEVNTRLAAMKAALEQHARLTAQLRELEEAAAEARDDAEVDGTAAEA